MNDITRCPNCQTAFRVTEAQLQAHRGKVRCGRCAFVFNAKECIESEQIAETISTPIMATAKPQAAQIITAVAPAANVSSEAAKPLAAAPPSPAIACPAPPVTRPKRIVPDPAPQIEVDFDITASDNHGPVIEIEIKAPPEPVSKPAAPIEESHPSEESHHDYRPIYTGDEEGLLEPPPRSKWQALLIGISIILMLSFIAQLGYQQRTQISMEFPWLRPKLILACQALGCTMPLPENAEMLRSEWSELSYVPEFPNIIQLNATLRNLAQYEQALPMLEVTLTDDQERIVLKKVFKPSEYLSAADKRRLKFDAQDDLRAFLQIDLGELHSTAYSIYWFYP
ncbi:DUF3426 domain-containing protein [Janthinobacterium sp. B9-8]|uniref:DUF3426 domain-containing protein n=1 Tax=Janthinobacterium sp. B9-8 TaxID=1236179 RepID=UPI00061CF909|nr:DUF3426 domain-containing protein [Janthinobacterium sp. B9-8]AMC33433.1 hypothetical protein VN23_01855 [Janthinobacterium sp. B9-8]